MIEKVNPMHPDKVADRVAGAIVDLAYLKNERPKIAVEVLLGHNDANIIIESSETFTNEEIQSIVDRISKEKLSLNLKVVPQDVHLAQNQDETIKCGDNGIFKGMPLTIEEKELSYWAKEMYDKYPYDGKHILNDRTLIVCQSNANNSELSTYITTLTNDRVDTIIINPLGEWTGGLNTDSGATNRKLGSDMAQSVTGGGLHGKDLSKADVSVNIYAFLKAQETGKPVELCCAIGDKTIDGKPYSEIVEIAKKYINGLGGFEKFAEWGLY